MARIILKEANTSIFSKLISKSVTNISTINTGVMNYVYRARAKDGSIYYLKQALEEAKKKNILSKDLTLIKRNRIESEYRSITALKDCFHKRNLHILPEILSFDKSNSILITRDLGASGFLQKDLEGGIFNKGIAGNIGDYIAYQHSTTFNKNIIIRKTLAEEIEHWNFFLSLRTKDLLKNMALSDLKKEIVNIYEDGIAHSHKLLVHMDFCPKNILYFPEKNIAVVDFEFTSGMGDPAYDLGFMIGHYVLFAMISTQKDLAVDSILKIYNRYLENVRGLTFSANIGERAWKYAGCTLLYRIVGASPAPYIKRRYSNIIIKAGKQLLKQDLINEKSIREIIKSRS